MARAIMGTMSHEQLHGLGDNGGASGGELPVGESMPEPEKFPGQPEAEKSGIPSPITTAARQPGAFQGKSARAKSSGLDSTLAPQTGETVAVPVRAPTTDAYAGPIMRDAGGNTIVQAVDALSRSEGFAARPGVDRNGNRVETPIDAEGSAILSKHYEGEKSYNTGLGTMQQKVDTPEGYKEYDEGMQDAIARKEYVEQPKKKSGGIR